MIRARVRSLVHALNGLAVVLRTQPNARIHLLAGVVVCALAYRTGFSAGEWALLIFAIALVWVAESLNTAIEFLADAAVPGHNALIRHAKDIAAAAVLLAAIAALLIGTLLFLPRWF